MGGKRKGMTDEKEEKCQKSSQRWAAIEMEEIFFFSLNVFFFFEEGEKGNFGEGGDGLRGEGGSGS